MLHVITTDKGPYASRFESDRSGGVVVIESDLPMSRGSFGAAHDELNSMEARHRAIGYANTLGIADARINGNTSGPYAVNKHGVPLEHVKDEKHQSLPLTHENMAVHRYRVDIPVTKRLV